MGLSWTALSKGGCSNISHPTCFCYSVILTTLPSSLGVYGLSPWTWVGLCGCLDQEGTVEVILHDFWGEVIKLTWNLSTVLWGSQAVTETPTDRNQDPGPQPAPTCQPPVDPLVPGWCHVGHRWAIPIEPWANYKSVSKRNDCSCFKPLPFKVVCYSVTENCKSDLLWFSAVSRHTQNSKLLPAPPRGCITHSGRLAWETAHGWCSGVQKMTCSV